MKEVIRTIVFAITLIGLLLALVIWSISNDVVNDIFSVLGACMTAVFATICLAIFAHWLSRPDTEEKSGAGNIDEEAG